MITALDFVCVTFAIQQISLLGMNKDKIMLKEQYIV